jgi:hypothetical protein
MKLATAILVVLFACVASTPRLTWQTSPKPEDLAQKAAES